MRTAAWAFLIGWGLHVADHLRRGMSASPEAVMYGGMLQGIVVIIAIVMALRAHDRAATAAIIAGLGSAVLFTYAHLLPNFWPAYQDSFISGPRINVTWFSWLTALSEIGTGLVFAVAGLRAVSARRPA
jgi:formate/nitrite transporter FocA (FNT family)